MKEEIGGSLALGTSEQVKPGQPANKFLDQEEDNIQTRQACNARKHAGNKYQIRIKSWHFMILKLALKQSENLLAEMKFNVLMQEREIQFFVMLWTFSRTVQSKFSCFCMSPSKLVTSAMEILFERLFWHVMITFWASKFWCSLKAKKTCLNW